MKYKEFVSIMVFSIYLLSMKKILMYSSNICHYCVAAKKLLEKLKFPEPSVTKA